MWIKNSFEAPSTAQSIAAYTGKQEDKLNSSLLSSAPLSLALCSLWRKKFHVSISCSPSSSHMRRKWEADDQFIITLLDEYSSRQFVLLIVCLAKWMKKVLLFSLERVASKSTERKERKNASWHIRKKQSMKCGKKKRKIMRLCTKKRKGEKGKKISRLINWFNADMESFHRLSDEKNYRSHKTIRGEQWAWWWWRWW